MNPPLMTSSLPACDESQEMAMCEKHGEFICKIIAAPVFGLKAHRSRCPLCTEEARDMAAADELHRKQGERAREVSGLLADAFIPTRFKDRTLESYLADNAGQKRALAVCKKYVEKWPEQMAKGTSLVLTGGPGTGKTHLACAVAGAVIHEHLSSAKFYTVIEAVRTIKDTYRKDSPISEQKAINNFLNMKLLILDEVGVQFGTEHEKILLFEILNGRYQNCLSTILISNLSATDLEAFLGQRVMDRYRECGAVIAFDWESQRGKQ